jgi:hypothetical protein
VSMSGGRFTGVARIYCRVRRCGSGLGRLPRTPTTSFLSRTRLAIGIAGMTATPTSTQAKTAGAIGREATCLLM